MTKAFSHIFSQFTLAVLLLQGTQFVSAQGQEAGACGAEWLHELRLENDLGYSSLDQMQEKSYRGSVGTLSDRRNAEERILPVVVHIIHNNGPENISDDRMKRSIEWLNDAFQNTGFYDPATGVDTDIRFCLAKRDPEETSSTGINRIVSGATDMSVDGHPALFELISWNTKDYINIWVVRNVCLFDGQCTTIGFANMPGAHGRPYDGIVVQAEYVGKTPESNTLLVHEMGHYLGLLHPFYRGCKNGNCLEDGDRVCDTPPSVATGRYPCELERNTCTTDADDTSAGNPFRPASLGGLGDQHDMDELFMDYSFSECQKAFTQGQKERMHFFIANTRSSLLASKGCYEPCDEKVQAEFVVNATEMNAGELLMTANHSVHATGYQWYVNGVPYSISTEFTLQLLEEGVHEILLEAYNDHIECTSDLFEMTIRVICPVDADFDFDLKSSSIVFDNLSSGADSIHWTIFQADPEPVYSSALDSDTYGFPDAGHYRICLEAIGEYCSDTDCREVYLSGSGFCISDGDEDADGLVGLFDADCPCDPDAYQAQCPVPCQVLPDSFPEITMQIKWISDPVVNFTDLGSSVICGDLNADGIVDIISHMSLGTYFNAERSVGIFTGTDGSLLGKTTYREMAQGVSTGSLGMYRHRSLQEGFIIAANFDTLICFNENGEIQWKSKSIWDYTNSAWSSGAINIADINGDGGVEIVLGSLVINAETGRLLASGKHGSGLNSWSPTSPPIGGFVAHSIVADLLPDPGLEIAAGNTVYKVVLNSTSDTIGNEMIPIIADHPVMDGYTGVADINLDGLLDVIVVRSSNFNDGGGVWVWDPRTREIIAWGEAGSKGGFPTIGDVDGDCIPEICVVFEDKLNLYAYTGGPELELRFSLPISEESGFTHASMFDFNLDGKLEIVYHDEHQIMIIDGSNGTMITSLPLTNGTRSEGPIIADIDNDGKAEIVVTGSQSGVNEVRIFAIESGGAPWAPARAVWNQQGYHVTNVNDDLTIPRVQQNQTMLIPGTENCIQPTCPAPYNNFNVQATMRTQEGCVQFPGIDLAIEITGYECSQDSLTFCYVVFNLSETIPLYDTFCIACYVEDPTGDHNQLVFEVNCSYFLLEPKGSTDTLCITGPMPPSLDMMYFVVNDDGSMPVPLHFPVTDLVECDYSNNIDSIFLGFQPLSLDLGPDIIKCESEVVTLYADDHPFVSWLWSDGTTDAFYSTSLSGLHFVTAYDACGRSTSDTIEITIDAFQSFSLGDDLEICANESFQLTIPLDSGWVQWFPSHIVDCDTCPTVNVSPDSTDFLIAVRGYQSCITSDTLLIVVNHPIDTLILATVCAGEGYTIFDTTLFHSGIYTFSEGQCDTLFQVDLVVLPADTVFLEFQLCEGDSVWINGKGYSDPGMHTLEATNIHGCDSIIFIILEMVEINFIDETVRLCRGDSVFVHGEWVKEAGIYYDTIDAVGCDTIVRTNVELLNSYFVESYLELCPGDSVFTNHQWIYEEGDYSFGYISIEGCDSIAFVSVIETGDPPVVIVDIRCEVPETQLSIPDPGIWSAFWDNGTIGNFAVYSYDTIARITFTTLTGCEDFRIIVLPLLPEYNGIPEFTDTIIGMGQEVVIHTGLSADWNLRWHPSDIISCDTCSTVSIAPNHNVEIVLNLEHISGCQVTRSFNIIIDQEEIISGSVYIPNVFSPNGDGINDVFGVFGDILHVDLLIFTRWGELIYYGSGVSPFWDGTRHGEPMSPGVYIFTARVQRQHDTEITTSGSITLVR